MMKPIPYRRASNGLPDNTLSWRRPDRGYAPRRFNNRLLLPAALLAALFLMLGGAANAADEKWYQVEMILFAHQSQNNDADRELWRDDFALDYPENLIVLRKYVPPPSIDELLPEMKTDLSYLRISESNPSQRRNERDQEERATTDADRPDTAQADADAEAEAELSERQARIVAAYEDPMSLDADPYILLTPDLLQQGQTATRLRNSASIRVLNHIAWRQPVSGRQSTAPVLIQAGDQYDFAFELEGTVALSENRYLQMDLELFFSSFERNLLGGEMNWRGLNAANTALPANAANSSWVLGDNAPFADNSNYRRRFTARLQHQQSFQSERLHYIDHPLFGVLVSIKPYEVPDPAMEMPEFDLNALPPRRLQPYAAPL